MSVVIDAYTSSLAIGTNKYEYVHKELKAMLKKYGYDTDLIDWSKEPEYIVYSVQRMIDDLKADQEFEAQNDNA